MAIRLLEGFDASVAEGDNTITNISAYLKQKYPASVYMDSYNYAGSGWGYGRAWNPQYSLTELRFNVPLADRYWLGYAYHSYTNDAGGGIYIRGNGRQHFNLKVYRGDFFYAGATNTYYHLTQSKSHRWMYIELMLYVHNTLGEYEIRVNGNTVAAMSNIDTAYITDGIDTIYFSMTGKCYFDDLYISDSGFLGPLKVEALLPSGAGSSALWTPSAGANYECVDEIPKNGDTDYVSAAAAATDLHACANLTHITGGIKAVQLNVDARTESTATNIRTKCKSGSTTADGATQSVVDTTDFDTLMEIEEVDPDTSSAWTASGVNGMEIGYEHLG